MTGRESQHPGFRDCIQGGVTLPSLSCVVPRVGLSGMGGGSGWENAGSDLRDWVAVLAAKI